jgi:hypothetical protein
MALFDLITGFFRKIPAPAMRKLHRQLIMDHTGHSVEQFDPADVVSLAEAERRFKELTGLGFIAAERVGAGQSKRIGEFKPSAEETLFIRPLVGG